MEAGLADVSGPSTESSRRARGPLAEVSEDQHSDLAEALRILAAAESGVVLRLMGGVAIRLKCPSAAAPPLARVYGDVDFFGRSSESERLIRLFEGCGYSSERRFNALHGHRRLLFKDVERSRRVDVLLDHFEMCHRLELGPRLELDRQTLPLADLLLTKLQVVEANHKDVIDAVALVVDHPVGEGPATIDAGYIAGLCGQDWGLNRTLEISIKRLDESVEALGLPRERTTLVRNRLRELAERIEREPKSLRWKARARVGERVRWYELPEEVS